MKAADFAAALVELWPQMWRYAYFLCRNRNEAEDLRAPWRSLCLPMDIATRI